MHLAWLTDVASLCRERKWPLIIRLFVGSQVGNRVAETIEVLRQPWHIILGVINWFIIKTCWSSALGIGQSIKTD